jgi:hypothetical protein
MRDLLEFTLCQPSVVLALSMTNFDNHDPGILMCVQARPQSLPDRLTLYLIFVPSTSGDWAGSQHFLLFGFFEFQKSVSQGGRSGGHKEEKIEIPRHMLWTRAVDRGQ